MQLRDMSAKGFTHWLHSLCVICLLDEPTDWLTNLVTDYGCVSKKDQSVSGEKLPVSHACELFTGFTGGKFVWKQEQGAVEAKWVSDDGELVIMSFHRVPSQTAELTSPANSSRWWIKHLPVTVLPSQSTQNDTHGWILRQWKAGEGWRLISDDIQNRIHFWCRRVDVKVWLLQNTLLLNTFTIKRLLTSRKPTK